MLIYVFDEEFKRAGVIDNASSAIFTQRYYDVGDFELYVAANAETVALLTNNPYIYRENDNTLYVIKSIKITSDTEQGNYITVSGTNIISLLQQRIIWNQTNVTGTVENAIRTFVNENAISPANADRVIPNLILGESAGLTDTITTQKTGTNLLDAIIELCQASNYGFKMTFNGENLIFSLYQGQEKNVYFSPDFDNLISSEYNYTSEDFANVALVAGEGEGISRKTASVGDASGINRFEIYVDARNTSTNDEEITSIEYTNMLKTQGVESIAEHSLKEEFSGEVSTEHTYIYGVDYNLGDIVTIQNEYGMTATSRIIETIECEDENGYSFIPTFDTWEVVQ